MKQDRRITELEQFLWTVPDLARIHPHSFLFERIEQLLRNKEQ
jgi:hypothetical protein